MDSIETLLTAAKIPTLIIPGNITFYPIRNDENFISKGVELFFGKISRAAKEELAIEGNILFKKTDMDVRFGQPIAAGISWNWWERVVLDRVFQRINNLHDMFALKPTSGRWVDRMISKVLGQQTGILRDEYTREIYSNITVNLGHIASRMIMTLLDRGTNEIDHEDFRTLIYISVKYAQRESSVFLHQDLESPEIFEGLHKGVWKRFEQFLVMAASSGLIEITSDKFRFLPKLKLKQDFHEIRLENAISVCANEIAPVTAACQAVDKAVQLKMAAQKTQLGRFLFDDEIRSFKLCRETYFKPRHADINEQETATESGEPFFLVPENARKIGVVLVHGFLASPAELRASGEKLAALGYPVIGVRLCGHGTSPWDLHDRTWRDWLESVRRGVDIMSAFADKICLIGFSAGGALALLLAAEQPKNVAGVVAISTPVKFRDRRMVFVPLVHGINKLINWVSPLEGVMPFSPNDAEHPEINYKNIPLRGVFELRRMVNNMKRRLGDVTCPVSVIQGDGDQVINPKSAEFIVDKIGSTEVSFHMIQSDRHGILNEDIGGTQELVTSFLASLSPEKEDSAAAKKRAPWIKSYRSLVERPEMAWTGEHRRG